jgi:hypothetical protein
VAGGGRGWAAGRLHWTLDIVGLNFSIQEVFVSFGSRRFSYLLDPEGFRIFWIHFPPFIFHVEMPTAGGWPLAGTRSRSRSNRIRREIDHNNIMRQSILLPTMARTKVCPMFALAALVAVSLLSSVDAASSHSTWRLPSLLNRPFCKLSSSMVHHRHRRRHVEMTAGSSPIKNAVFCVRGGGEGGSNGPCIGIDLGMSFLERRCFCMCLITHTRSSNLMSF